MNDAPLNWHSTTQLVWQVADIVSRACPRSVQKIGHVHLSRVPAQLWHLRVVLSILTAKHVIVVLLSQYRSCLSIPNMLRKFESWISSLHHIWSQVSEHGRKTNRLADLRHVVFQSVVAVVAGFLDIPSRMIPSHLMMGQQSAICASSDCYYQFWLGCYGDLDCALYSLPQHQQIIVDLYVASCDSSESLGELESSSSHLGWFTKSFLVMWSCDLG